MVTVDEVQYYLYLNFFNIIYISSVFVNLQLELNAPAYWCTTIAMKLNTKNCIVMKFHNFRLGPTTETFR